MRLTAKQRAVIAPLVVLLLPPLTACRTDGLQFTRDQRLTVLSPAAGTTVTMPLTVRWRADGRQRNARLAPAYAVFVDRAPIAPSTGLRSLADDACKARPGCPDLVYLAERRVYVSLADRVEIPAVANQSSSDLPGDHHVATIVLIDSSGRRLGESQWSVQFKVRESE